MTSSANQQWDYRCLTWTNKNLQTLRDGITETAKELGQQGWEMVNATLAFVPLPAFEYGVLCFFKRPID